MLLLLLQHYHTERHLQVGKELKGSEKEGTHLLWATFFLLETIASLDTATAGVVIHSRKPTVDVVTAKKKIQVQDAE